MLAYGICLQQGTDLHIAQLMPLPIGAGRILKVEGHSGGSNYFGAKRRKNFLEPSHFSVVPTQFFDGISWAQPSS